jgi:predicted permease
MIPAASMLPSKAVPVAGCFAELVAYMGQPFRSGREAEEREEEVDGHFLRTSINGAVLLSFMGLVMWVVSANLLGYGSHFRKFNPPRMGIVLCGVLAGYGAIRGVSDRGRPTMLVAMGVTAVMMALGLILTAFIFPSPPEWDLAIHVVMSVGAAGFIGYAPFD